MSDNFFDLLPDKLVIRIFTFLNLSDLNKPCSLRNLSMVCRRFRNLTVAPALWKVVSLPPWQQLSNEKAEEVIKRSAPELRYLRLLGQCSYVNRLWRKDVISLIRVAVESTEVEELDCEMPDEDMEEFFKLLDQSESLRRMLVRFRWKKPAHSVGVLVRNASCLRRMTHLRLEANKNNTKINHMVKALGEHCRYLEVFDIIYAEGSPDQTAMKYLIKRVHHSLKELTFDASKLNDDFFASMATCSKLAYLKLRDCFNMGQLGFGAILRLDNLETLDVSYSSRSSFLTDLDIAEAFSGRKLPNMQTLRLDGIMKLGDRSLEAIAPACPNLTYLWLDHCTAVTDEGMQSIIRECLLVEQLWLMGMRQLTKRCVEGIHNLTKLQQVCFVCSASRDSCNLQIELQMAIPPWAQKHIQTNPD